jgi:hypothetical protein
LGVLARVEAQQTPSNCTAGCEDQAVISQPSAANSIGKMRCQRRSCARSERRPHQIIQMTVQTCGIAASRPMVLLLAPPLKLLTISGVQTATMARLFTRQK